MSYVSLKDTAEGIQATVFDSPEADGAFESYDAGLLDRAVPHTIRFEIKLNPGADNDLMRIFIDGRDVGQCFTTWENYYHAIPAREAAAERHHADEHQQPAVPLKRARLFRRRRRLPVRQRDHRERARGPPRLRRRHRQGRPTPAR